MIGVAYDVRVDELELLTAAKRQRIAPPPAIVAELTSELNRAFEAMPRPELLAVVLTTSVGLTLEDVGTMLEVSTGHVGRLRDRAVRRLHARLG